jgi:hypothetical protein
VYSGRNPSTFEGNVVPSFCGPKAKTNKKATRIRRQCCNSCLLRSFSAFLFIGISLLTNTEHSD